MVPEFLAWWGAQMRSLAPSALLRFLTAPEDRLYLTVGAEAGGDPALELEAFRHGRTEPLGALGSGDAAIGALQAALKRHRHARLVLVVEDSWILEKSLRLPAAVQADLARVMAYELDQETPYSPDELLWSAVVVQRDRAAGQLDIRLSFVQKRRLAPVLALLQAAGARPATITARGYGREPRIALDRAEASGYSGSALAFLRRDPLTLAFAGCAVLALVAAALPFIRQSLAFTALDREIAELQPKLDELDRLRARLHVPAGEADAKNGLGNPLSVLAALTDVLPDQTHLVDLVANQRRLTITGQSADASGLIRLLTENGAFKEPGFAAPTTRDPRTQSDNFSIAMDVKPGNP